MIDVMRMLGTRPATYAAKVDELAERLVSGESLSRDEIRIFLDRIEATPEELQEAVDRLTRRCELLDTIRDAVAPRKRLGDIQAEIAAAQADVDRATGIVNRLQEKYGTTALDLQIRVNAADRAAEGLMELRNLPPTEAGRLKAARAAALVASDDIDTRRRELPSLRGELAQAEESLAEERSTLALHPRDANVVEQVRRAENRAKACAGRLKDAEAAIMEGERSLVTARRQRDAVEADIRSRYGA